MEMLDEKSKQILYHDGVNNLRQIRLAPNFFDKCHYVIHSSNLRFYLEQGLQLRKIHRGIRFFHSKWMKPYIEMNTMKRMAATSDFEKAFFKLLVSFNTFVTNVNVSVKNTYKISYKYHFK